MKNWINGALATCRFELRRSFSLQRTGVTLVLTLFPPLMVTLIIADSQVARASHLDAGDEEALRILQAVDMIRTSAPFMIVFLVSLVTLLSLLLWATPNVYSELEGKSWGFIASRPGGRISIYLGKFLASVLVSFSVAFLSMTMSVLIADRMLGLPDPEKLWLSLLAIYALASFVYAAIFSMLGALFFKRAMVVAAGYLVGSEFFLAMVPAVISKLTMRFHLQELGFHWIGFFLPFEKQSEYRELYGPAWPTWLSLSILLGTGVLVLVIGGFIIINRQYITADEA